MTSSEEIYRQACCRYDRIIANFLAVQCWLKGVDGVRITENEFRRMFSVNTLKRERIRWFLEDASDWFPETPKQAIHFNPGNARVLRRKVFTPELDETYDPGELSIVDCDKNLIPEYDEKTLIMYLQELALGLVGPQPTKKPRTRKKSPTVIKRRQS